MIQMGLASHRPEFFGPCLKDEESGLFSLPPFLGNLATSGG
jgi:hypothetical protein